MRLKRGSQVRIPTQENCKNTKMYYGWNTTMDHMCKHAHIIDEVSGDLVRINTFSWHISDLIPVETIEKIKEYKIEYFDPNNLVL